MKWDGILPSRYVHFSRFRVSCSTGLTARFRKPQAKLNARAHLSFCDQASTGSLSGEAPRGSFRHPPVFPLIPASRGNLATESTLFRFKTGRQNPVSEETASTLKEERSDAACVFCFDAFFSSVGKSVAIGCALQLETPLAVQCREAPSGQIMARPWRLFGSPLLAEVMRPIKRLF